MNRVNVIILMLYGCQYVIVFTFSVDFWMLLVLSVLFLQLLLNTFRNVSKVEPQKKYRLIHMGTIETFVIFSQCFSKTHALLECILSYVTFCMCQT